MKRSIAVATKTRHAREGRPPRHPRQDFRAGTGSKRRHKYRPALSIHGNIH